MRCSMNHLKQFVHAMQAGVPLLDGSQPALRLGLADLRICQQHLDVFAHLTSAMREQEVYSRMK
jgi:hypothetical protein